MVLRVLRNVAAATPDDSRQEEIEMQSIDSVQYYRSAAHIASNTVDYQPGTYSTDSTSRMTRREAVGVDAAVSGHVREIASSRDAAHDVRPQRWQFLRARAGR